MIRNHQQEASSAKTSIEQTIIMAMPKYVSIQSNYSKKYLSYNKDTTDKFYRFVQSTSDMAVTPYSKFQVEESSSSPGLVHVRCCYNNRYWRLQSAKDTWIAAANDFPEEDKTKWSCTLFKPEFVDDNTLRIIHVQTGNYICLWRTIQPPYNSLFVGYKVKDRDSCDLMTIVDWDKMVVLPRHVFSFKGDNDMYLGTRAMEEGKQYLQYSSPEEGDPSAAFEIMVTPDGSIRIKSVYTYKYWRRNADNWIMADADDEMIKGNKDCLFCPVQLETGVIAFRSVGNNSFCKRYTANGKIDCLAAVGTSQTNLLHAEKYPHNVVSYLVTSREIYDIKFNLDEARIYGGKVETIATAEGVNAGKQETVVKVNLTYIDGKSSVWTDSTTVKAGHEVDLRSGLPVVNGNKAELSGSEFNGTYIWGQSQKAANKVTVAYEVTVPPMSTVKVMLMATVSVFDVPFAYTEHDFLTSGQELFYKMDGGMYSCSANCNYNFTVVTEKLF